MRYHNQYGGNLELLARKRVWASVLDGEGVVVGREEDLGLKHEGVVLSFLVLGFTNGGAGGDVGEVGPGRGTCDDGDIDRYPSRVGGRCG